ncbi:uncharacterized protein [Miscanthus floridulus]|uniref:uncharacterized protein n=1 Tax=Miscanthus floridulus TaxID=154761 RepID=UPI00345AF12F
MRLGADQVKEVKAQRLLREFENIAFKEGESIDEFGMRISNLAAELKTMGETVEDSRVIKKFLRVVPSRFSPVVVSIEMFYDMKKMTVEELVGRLRAAEERLDDKVEHTVDKMARLMLAEEDWLEKHKHHFVQGPKDGGGGSSGGTSSGSHGGHGGRSGHHKGKAAAHSDGGGSGGGEQDCKRPEKEKKKEQKQPEVNVAIGGAEPGALMLATCDVDVVRRPTQTMHLSEKVTPVLVLEGVWVLDTGASNHMTGTRSALT